MAYKKRKKHVVRNIILCLLLVVILAAAALGGVLGGKLKKLQQGAKFEFAYTVTPTGGETPVLYSVLERTGAAKGDVYGVYAPGKLLLSLYQLSGAEPAATWSAGTGEVTLYPEAKAAEPFTRVYIDSAETLYDVGQLYSVTRDAIVSEYSLADMLLPTWGLGSYISQTQLAAVLGVDASNVEMQDMAGFTLALSAMRPAEPSGALEGFSYLKLELPDADTASPELIIGAPLKGLLAGDIPLHILLTIPEHSVKVELLGTLSAASTAVIEPTSRMSDEDVERFVQIRETVEQLLQFIQQAAGQGQSNEGQG